MKANGTVIESKLNENTTNWGSIYTASIMLGLCAMNISIYYMSIWAYTKSVRPDTETSMLGWITAANSFGCLLANPLFGWWSEKTMSSVQPVAFGFIITAIGNLIYGLLPMMPSIAIPVLLLSRFLSGIGIGILGVLRSFTATCSTREDRMSAVACASTGLTIGMSIGPVFQLCFMFIGPTGISFFGIVVNQYTAPGFTMAIISMLCVVFLFAIFEESYAGIISNEEKAENPFMVLPKYDRFAVAICFYLWAVPSAIAISIYTVASPLTISMYNWTPEEAVTKNASLQTVSCLASVLTNILLGKTRLGKVDHRILIICGMSSFVMYMVFNYPWFFYEGPLDYISEDSNSTFDGGCPPIMEWCAYSTRVPLSFYYFFFILALGSGFPLTVSPLNALFSKIVGPRKQSFLQGMMMFSASLSQFISPLITMFLYEHHGFQYIAVFHFIMSSIGIFLVLMFYNRMTPLKMVPPIGQPTKYKRGTFYKF